MTHRPLACCWPVGPKTPTLDANEIHVWCICLSQSSQQFEALLTPDELVRANRFKFSHLRQHFVAGRGALRVLLGRYLAANPASLRFEYGEQGKPALAGPPSIHFNLAHSYGLALLAIARQELGVDVEAIRPMPDRDSIARRFFSPTEVELLNLLPKEQKSLAFFTCWTRKEAFLKATGDGLSRPLDSFAVTLHPAEPARFLHITGHEAGLWQLIPLEPATDYIGALAITSSDWQVRLWAWPDS